VPVEQLGPQKLPCRAPKTQAQAPPLVTSSRLAGLGKLVDDFPEADWFVTVSAHGLEKLRCQRVLDPCHELIRDLRRGRRCVDVEHALTTAPGRRFERAVLKTAGCPVQIMIVYGFARPKPSSAVLARCETWRS
jgi:hypothetical protein